MQYLTSFLDIYVYSQYCDPLLKLLLEFKLDSIRNYFRCTYADWSYFMNWSAFNESIAVLALSNIAKRMQSSL